VLGADGSGSLSSAISGVTWSVNDIVSKGRIGKAIIVMPIGGSYSAALNNAVDSASAQGVPVFVPAGSSSVLISFNPNVLMNLLMSRDRLMQQTHRLPLLLPPSLLVVFLAPTLGLHSPTTVQY
jgi:hypothetical protein